MHFRKIGEHQPPVEFAADGLLLVMIEPVPLVAHDDQRAAAVDHVPQQVNVLLDQPVVGIDQHQHHVGIGDCLQGLDDREFLHGFVHAALAPHAGGIDQRVVFLRAVEGDINAVARGAGLIIDDHPLFPEDAIHQGRFAHVRAPHDGHLDPPAGIIRRLLGLGSRRKICLQRLDQLRGAAPVRGAHGV